MSTVSLVKHTVAARHTAGLVVMLPTGDPWQPLDRFSVEDVRPWSQDPQIVVLWGNYPDEGNARGVAHIAAGAALSLSADQIA